MTWTRRAGIGAAAASLAVGGVMVAAPANAATAPITSVSVGQVAKLGPQGMAATLKVTYVCAPTAAAGLSGVLKQPGPGRQIALASGVGPAVCDGVAHTTRLQMNDNSLTFVPGRATATVAISVDNPETGGMDSTSTGLRRVTLRWHF